MLTRFASVAMARGQSSFLQALLLGLVALSAVPKTSAFFESFFGGAKSGGGGGGARASGGGGAPAYATFPGKIRDEIAEEWEWLVGTEWFWNNWRNVKFAPDGIFEAPTDDCQAYAEACRWAASGNKIYIMWGNSGLHVLKASAMEAGPSTKLKGKRHSDKDPCSATFVGKDEVAEEVDLYVVHILLPVLLLLRLASPLVCDTLTKRPNAPCL